MYAGTNQGVYISHDGGRDWVSVGLEERSITDIAIHPENQDILYVAAGKEGLVKSSSGGKDWVPLNIVLPASLSIQGPGDIRAVVIDSSRPSTVYAASFQGYILKSDDDGQSWSVLNPEFPLQALNSLAVDPDDGKTLYIGTGGNGILKSSDGGKTWKNMNNGLEDLTVTRLVIDPANATYLYAGTYGGGVYISHDRGQSWQAANTGLTDRFVYALTAVPGPGDRKPGLLGRLVEKNSDSTELFVGVFGGAMFKGMGKGEVNWQPVTTEKI